MSDFFDPEDNPFRDQNQPSVPLEAFTSDRSSPKRNHTFQEDKNSSEEDEFSPFPQTPHRSPYRHSPNIFARSTASAAQVKGDLTNKPLLSYGETPRSEYTNKESPKRKRRTELFMNNMNEDRVSVSRDSSPRRPELSKSITSTTRSERFLEPPKPIFSPETFAEANPNEDQTTLSSDAPTYAFEEYGKEDEMEAKSLYSESTAYSGPSYVSGDTNGDGGDYFAASLDSEVMGQINQGYVPKREKTLTKRKVRLVGGNSGNLILENPIPEELKKVLTRTESPFGEFTHMTYTACTSDPDTFIKDGFTLRAKKYGRQTEIVICVTMYNEDEQAFARTMHAVMKNVAHLCKRHKSSVWGKDSWKKVQVIIIADGRNKVNQSVLELLTATGCYQDNLARPYVNNKEVKAHLYEYTAQISIDENFKFKGDEKSLTPVQVMLCLKEKNQKKINSHRWLFNSFCPILDPNVIVLLDVGTKPDNHTVYNLWKAFDRDSNVAGAAGEIKAMKGKGWLNLLNPLVASQNFEYKMSNILDKPLESMFGYISVLPGALSAYRYIALKNNEDGTGPLATYFKGEDLLGTTAEPKKNSKANFFEANMYLAEDRILCWELVSRKDENWVLKFVKLATGETDVPETIPEFLLQRRRWINGAFFAALYALRHASSIRHTRHSFTRKFWLYVEFIYQLFNVVFSFFSLSNFYLTFYFLTGSLVSNKYLGHGGFWIFTIFNYICICCLTSLFIISIGNKPQVSRRVFKTLVILLSICALYALVVGLYFVIDTVSRYGMGESSTYVFVSIIVSILCTYGLYTIMSILYLDPWHMLTCSVQYFLMIPFYTCTLQIFAFCNTHDVSWGTKGDTHSHSDKSNQYIIEKNEKGDFEAIVTDVNVDEVYLETLYNIKAKRSSKKVDKNKAADPIVSGEDYAKDVRSKVVLIWLLANLIFIMAMLQVYEPGATDRNVYLAFILWTVCIIAVFRAVGSIGYLIHSYVRFLVETKSKWSHRRQGYSATRLNPLN